MYGYASDETHSMTVRLERNWLMYERMVGTLYGHLWKSNKSKGRARKEASAQEVRGYYKQFAEAKHFE